MDKAIKLLREQMIICSRLNELFNELNNALKESRSGSDVTSSVQSIEPLMKNLSDNDNKIQEFLKSIEVPNLKALIEAQPDGTERNVANSLLNKVWNLQKRLRHQITNVARLLVNSKSFIDYNINVMTQTVASNTYGPMGSNNNLRNVQKRRMFDANV